MNLQLLSSSYLLLKGEVIHHIIYHHPRLFRSYGWNGRGFAGCVFHHRSCRNLLLLQTPRWRFWAKEIRRRRYYIERYLALSDRKSVLIQSSLPEVRVDEGYDTLTVLLILIISFIEIKFLCKSERTH